MTRIRDNKHWYDGWFYARLTDPFAKEIREIISDFIKKDSAVIDIGCGTGALVFKLAKIRGYYEETKFICYGDNYSVYFFLNSSFNYWMLFYWKKTQR